MFHRSTPVASSRYHIMLHAVHNNYSESPPWKTPLGHGGNRLESHSNPLNGCHAPLRSYTAATVVSWHYDSQKEKHPLELATSPGLTGAMIPLTLWELSGRDAVK